MSHVQEQARKRRRPLNSIDLDCWDNSVSDNAQGGSHESDLGCMEN